MRQRLTISDSYHFQCYSIVGFQGVYIAGVLVITPFRCLNNLVNSIHKRALKFTYDDKDSKLNDIAPPNMKAYQQRLKSCFALSIILSQKKQPKSSECFWTMKYCSLSIVSFARISLEEPPFFGNRNTILRHMRITNTTFI